jgi:hypothetical protein
MCFVACCVVDWLPAEELFVCEDEPVEVLPAPELAEGALVEAEPDVPVEDCELDEEEDCPPELNEAL